MEYVNSLLPQMTEKTTIAGTFRIDDGNPEKERVGNSGDGGLRRGHRGKSIRGQGARN